MVRRDFDRCSEHLDAARVRLRLGPEFDHADRKELHLSAPPVILRETSVEALARLVGGLRPAGLARSMLGVLVQGHVLPPRCCQRTIRAKDPRLKPRAGASGARDSRRRGFAWPRS